MIFHEIAVEPEAIRSLRDLQCVLGLAGFGKGRLIANFPHKESKTANASNWVGRVIESVKVADIGKVGKVRELLIDERKRLLRSRLDFCHDLPWIENARKANRERSFAAMIIDGFPVSDNECQLDDLGRQEIPSCLRDDQHARPIPKDPGKFAEFLLPMTRCASTLRFADPHYLWWDDRAGLIKLSRRHAKVAEAIARQLADIDRIPNTVELHLLEVPNDPEGCVRTFSTEMAAHLPRSWKATVFVWREKVKRFHARYILTDVGGVGSDYGLDEGRSTGDETDIYLLTEAMLAQTTTDFSPSGSTFTLAAEPLEFSGTVG
jgi:hypothetical protein